MDAFTARVILDPSFWVAFILFFAVCSTTIVLILIKMYRLDQKNAFRTAIIVWLGAPFIYIVMRGNTIYFALIFLLLFLLLYRSERPWVRELSYIFLTLAGAIKIYPLFFGVFLLHRKKIFACVRIALYSALSFFLSFFFFEEGWDGLMRFIKNLFLFSDSDTRMVGGTNVSLNSILYKLVAPFSQDAADSAIFQKIQLGLVILIFLVCTILAVRTKSNFSRSVLAAAVVILVPSVSYFYTISFAIIPLMNFFQSFDSMTRKKQIFYLIAFAFLFFSPFLLSQNFALHGVIILVMMIIEAVEIIRNEGFLRAKKQIEQ